MASWLIIWVWVWIEFGFGMLWSGDCFAWDQTAQCSPWISLMNSSRSILGRLQLLLHGHGGCPGRLLMHTSLGLLDKIKFSIHVRRFFKGVLTYIRSGNSTINPCWLIVSFKNTAKWIWHLTKKLYRCRHTVSSKLQLRCAPVLHAWALASSSRSQLLAITHDDSAKFLRTYEFSGNI